MMFFARKKVPDAVPAPKGEAARKPIPSFWGQAHASSDAPAPDCAIWNDIARALDAKPRTVK